MMKRLFFLSLLACTVFLSWCTQKFYLNQEFYETDGEFINITSDDFKDLNFQNYILFVYNNYCVFSVPCDEIFKQYMEENNINFLSMSYEEFKNTKLHSTVQYAPSILIVHNWKIVDFLNAEDNEDTDKYQSVEEFWNWISNYIYIDN